MCSLATRAVVLAYSVPGRVQTDKSPGHCRLQCLTPLGKGRYVAASLEGGGLRLQSGLFSEAQRTLQLPRKPLTLVFSGRLVFGGGQALPLGGSVCI